MATQNFLSPSKRWIHGPVPDLLIGCGVLYVVAFVAMTTIGPGFPLPIAGYWAPLLILLVSLPHYGATLLRVYGDPSVRSQHRRYSVWATLLLGAVFVVSLQELYLGSLLVTLYMTWSLWHYTAQNYGLTLMFLRRRDVPVSD